MENTCSNSKPYKYAVPCDVDGRNMNLRLDWMFDGFLKDWGNDWELGPDPKEDVLHDRKVYRNKLKELGVNVDES